MLPPSAMLIVYGSKGLWSLATLEHTRNRPRGRGRRRKEEEEEEEMEEKEDD